MGFMKIELAYLCKKGGKSVNDDSVFVSEGKNRLCVYIGDGLGGYNGGKTASEVAGKAVLSCYNTEPDVLSENWMINTAQQAQAAVQKVQSACSGAMKTTLVVLVANEKYVRWMHIGDSRLYYFVNGRVREQTKDHSVSQLAVMMGDISPDQIRFHEDRNRILRALGGENATPEISPVVGITYQKKAFLLCTDGFWEYVNEAEMEKTLRCAKNPQDWLDRMEAYLLRRIPPDNDNYTAVAIFISNRPFHNIRLQIQK